MMKKFLWMVCLVLGANVFGSMPWFNGSTQVTPEKYEVRIRRISFRKSGTDEWVVYADVPAEQPWDIGSLNPGEIIGQMGVGNTLANGTYDAMRFHISPEFTIKASVQMPSGRYAFTDGSIDQTDNIEGFGEMFLANTSASPTAASDHVLTMPTGQDAQNELEGGDTFYETLPNAQGQDTLYFTGDMTFGGNTFTITKAHKRLPVFDFDFDLINATEFYQPGGDPTVVTVMPGGPGIELFMDGVLVFSEDEN